MESEEVPDESTPLIHSGQIASPSTYQPTQKPMDGSVLRIGFLGQIQKISKKAKILLCVTIASITALMLYLLLAPSNAQEYCVRRGYKAFETPIISFNTSSVAIFLTHHGTGGIIKISQLTSNDSGVVYARANISTGNFADSIQHVVDIDKREARVSISWPALDKSKECVYVEVELQIPAHTTALSVISAQNIEIVAATALVVDFVKMYSNEAPIQFLRGWQGKDLILGASNNDLDFRGNRSLHATHSIELTNWNSLIRLDDSSSASIRTRSYSGRVEMRNTTATSSIEPITWDGVVSLQDTHASNITIYAQRMGSIYLDHVVVDNTLIAKTEHGAIHAQLDGSPSIKAALETYDGNVNVTMPDDFSGRFAVYSSSSANVTIIENHDIVIDKNLSWKKTGHTYNDGEGFMRVRALYSHVKLTF
ncbi:hypothetical protein BJV82DRAFT_673754 [Fennellomyces sp. T-0311]|nr:hypothetical protein BJV82DRAFT_673754 [Fennellomyces sp. T-0311]